MELNILNNSPFIEILNWKDILQQLSTHLYLDYNRDRIYKLKFLKTKKQIEDEFDILSYFLEHHDIIEHARVALQHLPANINFSISLHRLKKSSWLEAEEINTLFLGVEFYLNTFSKKNTWSKGLTPFFQIDENNLHKFKQKILIPYRKIIQLDGSIDYLAHPELKAIYYQVQQLQSSLRQQIKVVLGQHAKLNTLQNDQFDIVNGHYVLAVRSDSYQSNFGIIRGKSQSNLTLYVEPYELVSTNQKLEESQSQLENMLYKVLNQITQQLTPFFHLLKNIEYIVNKFDLCLGKASYSKEHRLTRPQISTDTTIKLNSFFHPLLQSPISNDLLVKNEQNGLVISGPNTGGKTVALKSIALCCLFLRFGMFVPAQEAQLPLFDGIYFFANDHQDITEGLSSFAAETKNYLHLLETLETNSIIFIDEVFNSTSSEEASALAMALIDRITELSAAKIFISTHHYSFKTLIQTRKNFINGHVGIDNNNFKPTYKIHYGSPGSSMALEIFSHLTRNSDKCHSLVKDAKKYLQKDQIKYENLLQNIATQEGLLHQERMHVQQLEKDLLQQKENTKHLLRLEKEEIITKYEKELNTIIRQGEKLLTNIKRQEIISPKTFHNKVANIRQQLNSKSPTIKQVSKDTPKKLFTPDFHQLKEGSEYYCTKSNNMVTLISMNPSKQVAKVRHKNFKFDCNLNELFINKEKANKIESTQVNYTHSQQLNIEVKCLGMRLEEFQDLVHNYLAALQLEQLPYVIITHGHGDGVLKRWLRNFISKEKAFQWTPVDGNDGQTRIELK